MTLPATHEVTTLLQAWDSGDEQAIDKLTPLPELIQGDRSARRRMAMAWLFRELSQRSQNAV